MTSNTQHMVSHAYVRIIGALYTCKPLILHIVDILYLIGRICFINMCPVFCPAKAGGVQTARGRRWFYTPLRDFKPKFSSYESVIRPISRALVSSVFSSVRLTVIGKPNNGDNVSDIRWL